MRVGSHTKQKGSVAARIRKTDVHPQELSCASVPRNDVASAPGGVLRGGIARVPTHAVRRGQERRAYVRVRLALSMRVERIAGQRDVISRVLQTQNISSSGVYFYSPCRIEPGTPIEMELLVVDRPWGRGSVRMRTDAHVVRVDEISRPGWHGLAAAFDDISFIRDEPLPPQFQTG